MLQRWSIDSQRPLQRSASPASPSHSWQPLLGFSLRFPFLPLGTGSTGGGGGCREMTEMLQREEEESQGPAFPMKIAPTSVLSQKCIHPHRHTHQMRL